MMTVQIVIIKCDYDCINDRKMIVIIIVIMIVNCDCDNDSINACNSNNYNYYCTNDCSDFFVAFIIIAFLFSLLLLN